MSTFPAAFKLLTFHDWCFLSPLSALPVLLACVFMLVLYRDSLFADKLDLSHLGTRQSVMPAFDGI